MNLSEESSQSTNLEYPIDIIKKGGVVIFPTDTAFGIGCRIDRKESVERLFKLRNRSHDKAVPVLVSDMNMAKEYADDITSAVEKVMEKYWPGGLTIVVKAKKEKIPSLVRGGGETIGIRMPDNRALLTIIKKVGVPLLGPSANFAGKKTPYNQSEIDKKLQDLVDYTVLGETKGNIHSTVLDTTKSPWKILREGAVKKEGLL